jgi:surface protein
VEVRRSSDNVSQSIGFDSFGNFDTASLNRFIATGSGVLAGSYSGLAAAYSLRKAVPGYAGDAIEVQSGSVSQSIGFDANGNLDTGSLLTFAGSGNAFVKTWYDQSGNNNHATQSVAASQPLIISSGSLVIENGKPSVQFIRNSYTHLNVSNFVRNDTIDSFIITNPLFSNLNSSYLNDIQGVGRLIFGFSPSQSGPGIYKGNWLTDSSLFIQSQSLFSIKYDSSNSYIYANSILKTSGNAGNLSINGTLIIGGEGFSTAFEGRIQELIYYFSDQSTNRTYIENNINSYYGIYTPDSVSTEDAFVKTWYDQSGNNRHTTQVSESRQPQIVENGTIVLDQSRPSLKWNNGIFLYNTSSYTLNSVAWAARSTDGTGFSTIVDTGDQLGISPNVYYDQGIRTYNGLYNTVGNNADANDLVFDSGSMFFNGKTTTTSNNIQTGHVGFLRVDSTKTSATRTQIGIHFSYDRAWKGYISELVLYSTNLTSSRGLIEDNINGYYNIFTHSLDSGSGYVTTWYDQSGNDRHATQITSSRQPQIISSGSVILENNKPSIRFDFNKKTLLDAGDFSSLTEAESFLLIKSYMEGLSRNDFIDFGSSTSANHYPFNNIIYDDFGSTVRKQTGVPVQPVTQLNIYGVTTKPNLWQSRINLIPQFQTNSNTVGFRTNAQIGQDNDSFFFRGWISELTIYPADQSSNRIGITSNINTYFNVYTQPVYNQNSNSLSLYSNPTTVAGAANNVASASFTTGGPLGLITVSRTGSSNYTLWKNRVPNKVTTSPSVPQSTELYLNAANLNNSLFSASQNNIAYASVGAGLTDDEVYTYYELVDELQTELGRGVTDPNAFITTWDTRITGTGTVTGTSSIALPLYGTQAITASWGDGTVSLISQSAQVDRTHSYAEPGIYTVSITGQGQGFQFNNGGDRAKLMDIGQWGSISGSVGAVFFGCTNLVGTAADIHPVAGLTSYFRGTVKFNGAIGNWNTSDITDMLYTFGDATAFNQPIGSWNVGNVTRMTNTFLYASSFNQNIGNWDVSKVTEMARMFDQSPFNNGGSPDINNWRPISCSDFTSMFANCPFNQPIGNWPISASNITMNSMFRNADAFNQNLGSWDVSRVTNMGAMFQDNGIFNNSGSNLINNWRPISCSFFGSMFYNSPFNQPIGNWTIGTGSQIPATGINMQYMFSTSPFNQNIGAWNVEKVTAMNSMFQSAGAFNNSGSSDINNWRPISCSNFSGMFSISYSI